MNSIHLGRRVANCLVGAWRMNPAVHDAPIGDIADRLQDGGLSGLVWNRLPQSIRRTALGRRFWKGAIGDATNATRLDDILVNVVKSMRAAGVEPIVTKGWAVARHYLSPGNRPYSDIDLSVRPDQTERARQVLESFGHGSPAVDLHSGAPDLMPTSWNEIFGRSESASLNGHELRVLSPADQFRLLVAHLLRHYCHRPLNLVDIAVLLENGLIDNWEMCLRGSHAWRRWVLAVAALAQRLLGATLPEVLARHCSQRAPSWLEEATLWHWGGGEELDRRQVFSQPMEWWPAIAYRSLNVVRWPYRFGMPPMRLPQPIWAAAVLGRGLQPINRLWRGLFRPRRTLQPYQMHAHPIF